jgi:hypothetical protein
MAFAKLRLLIAIALLLSWLGYLAHQALSVGRFPVVSHAQILVSTLDVIADVQTGADGKPVSNVVVHEVRWPSGQQKLVGLTIDVTNLPDPSTNGFAGAGRYILPLVAGEGGTFRVAGLPRSPGFDGYRPCFIYPDTLVTRQQLEGIPKPADAGLAPAIE